MNLTIDIGNSFIKTLIFEDTFPVYRNVSETLTSIHITRLLSKFPIKYSMLSSVVDIKKPVLNALNKLPHLKKFTGSTSIPIKNLYETPSTLGKDRLANAIAGAFLFPGKNVLIIDAGTCIKYDFINSKKEYLGGSISPGLQMRFKSLHHFTSKLPLVKELKITELTGRSTVKAMQTGVIIGICEEMKGFIHRYKSKYKSLQIILTGGDADHFVEDLKLSIFAAEDLVNIGLNEIIRYNVAKRFQK